MIVTQSTYNRLAGQYPAIPPGRSLVDDWMVNTAARYLMRVNLRHIGGGRDYAALLTRSQWVRRQRGEP